MGLLPYCLRSRILGKAADEQLDPTFGYNTAGQISSVVNPKLLHGGETMFLDSFDAKAELVGNLFAGEALANKLKHLDFA